MTGRFEPSGAYGLKGDAKRVARSYLREAAATVAGHTALVLSGMLSLAPICSWWKFVISGFAAASLGHAPPQPNCSRARDQRVFPLSTVTCDLGGAARTRALWGTNTYVPARKRLGSWLSPGFTRNNSAQREPFPKYWCASFHQLSPACTCLRCRLATNVDSGASARGALGITSRRGVNGDMRKLEMPGAKLGTGRFAGRNSSSLKDPAGLLIGSTAAFGAANELLGRSSGYCEGSIFFAASSARRASFS